MSGATGAAGGATGGLPGVTQGGGSYGGGLPPLPGDHAAASTSVMPQLSGGMSGQMSGQMSGGMSGGMGGGFSSPQTPPQPPAPPSVPPGVPPGVPGGMPSGVPAPPSTPPAAPGGFSQPTTYTKGQPTPARGTRTNQGGGTARRPGPAAPAAGAAAGAAGRVRKARLRITKVDPWSVMKVSFLLAIAAGVVLIVASCVLWMVLDGLGVFDSLSSTLKDATGSGQGSSSAFNLMDYFGFGQVLMFSTLIAVVDVVLITALATLSAFIYNSAAGFAGGVELTLAEEN